MGISTTNLNWWVYRMSEPSAVVFLVGPCFLWWLKQDGAPEAYYKWMKIPSYAHENNHGFS